MKNKNLSLILGIVSFLVFIGYLSESEPHSIFGLSINIWIIRLIWLAVALVNISNYIKLKKENK